MERFCKYLPTAQSNRKWGYQSLSNEDAELGEKAKVPDNGVSRRLICGGIVLLATIFVTAIGLKQQFDSGDAHPHCPNPIRRQEWRTLTATEQENYISAVQCLQSKESLLQPGSSRYDDFVYAHVYEGTDIHYAAGFLPWHRYFIHVFEKTLVEQCQYQGCLPYWDWGLDAHQLAASPVFSPRSGFGGDGDHESPSVGAFEGRCMAEGPFANTSRYWVSKNNGHGFDVLHHSHCFSRNFRSGSRRAELQARVHPAEIERVLSIPTYTEFVDALERQSHNSIPQFIGGDFTGLTAPNGKIPSSTYTMPKSTVYGGYGRNRIWQIECTRMADQRRILASMDVVSLGFLAEPVQVFDLMTTQSKHLCYRY